MFSQTTAGTYPTYPAGLARQLDQNPTGLHTDRVPALRHRQLLAYLQFWAVPADRYRRDSSPADREAMSDGHLGD